MQEPFAEEDEEGKLDLLEAMAQAQKDRKKAAKKAMNRTQSQAGARPCKSP